MIGVFLDTWVVQGSAGVTLPSLTFAAEDWIKHDRGSMYLHVTYEMWVKLCHRSYVGECGASPQQLFSRSHFAPAWMSTTNSSATLTPLDLEKEPVTKIDPATTLDPFHVLLEPSEDPQNLSPLRKWIVVIVISSASLCVTCASSVVGAIFRAWFKIFNCTVSAGHFHRTDCCGSVWCLSRSDNPFT
jgi:hypothetical protein